MTFFQAFQDELEKISAAMLIEPSLKAKAADIFHRIKSGVAVTSGKKKATEALKKVKKTPFRFRFGR